jgi:hypothetical protein
MKTVSRKGHGMGTRIEFVQIVTRRSDSVSQIPRCDVTYIQTLIHFEICSLERPVTETVSSFCPAAIQHKKIVMKYNII